MSMNATFVQVDAGELSQSQTDPSSVEALFQDRLQGAGSHTVLSLDKAWHGVHYVLCGEAEPGPTLLSQAVLSGANLGEEAAQVAEIAQALSRPELESESCDRYLPGLTAGSI